MIQVEFKERRAKRNNPWGETLEKVKELIIYRHNYYEKYALQKILSNEALEVFENKYDKKDYKKFLAFLGMETGLESSCYHYGLNHEYTELLYKANELSFFTLREISGGYTGLEHFHKLKTLVYGKENSKEIFFEKDPEKSIKNPLADYNSPILKNAEKLYLLHLLYHYPVPIEKGFSSAEFARLIHLTSSSIDKKILSETPGRVYTYQKMVEGINMKKTKGIDKRTFLDELIDKISRIELPETLRILQKKRAEIK